MILRAEGSMQKGRPTGLTARYETGRDETKPPNDEIY